MLTYVPEPAVDKRECDNGALSVAVAPSPETTVWTELTKYYAVVHVGGVQIMLHSEVQASRVQRAVTAALHHLCHEPVECAS